jgi:hypothetical protein
MKNPPVLICNTTQPPISRENLDAKQDKQIRIVSVNNTQISSDKHIYNSHKVEIENFLLFPQKTLKKC